MSEISIFLILAVPVALGAFFIWFGTRKQKKLKPKEAAKLIMEADKFAERAATERIVGYDKVLDHFLTAMGYRGTMGEKLKRKPAVLGKKLEEIWKLHKIRNRLVHDLEPIPGLEAHADRYQKILLELLTR